MKAINIHSLIDAKRDLSDENFSSYIRHFALNPKLRPAELADIAILIENLKLAGAKTAHFNEFFVGYSIHQISKEFDLLRIGENFVLNVELKSESPKERIENQLIQNAYYLRFLNKPVYNFTYVTSNCQLYKLENGRLQKSNIENLFSLMNTQQIMYDVAIDELFDPIHYLVSPMEEPHSFMNNEYFLTAQQTTYKTELMNRQLLSNEWLAINGGPGTGKTLLTYDVVKDYLAQGQTVTIVHCRPLQEGQHTLIQKYGWNIKNIHHWKGDEPCDVLIVDEAQHLTMMDFQRLYQFEQHYHPKIILSYDSQTYLHEQNIIQEIEQKVKLIHFELKVIIRYNKEIQTFINCLFDLTYDAMDMKFNRISIDYFHNIEDAEEYLISLQEQHWKVINVGNNIKSHELAISNDIIGQEFDYVAAVIDSHFYYKSNMRLACKGIDYEYEQPIKVLFHTISRTRKNLKLVIVNNEEVLKTVLNILNKN